MSDSVLEIMDYIHQERANKRSGRLNKNLMSEQAKQDSVCPSTQQGHYWYVTPPPVQHHYCRDCHATKSYRLHTGEKFVW